MNRPKQLGLAPRLKIQVPADVIASACARDSGHCMIADSIKKAHPSYERIAVDIQTIRASNKKKGERYVWLTPRSVQKAIIAFDQGKKPVPFSLKLGYGQSLSYGKSDENKAEQRAYYAKNKTKLKRKKAAFRNPKGKAGGNIPAIVGGQAPPVAAGRRRQFGLRAMEY